jgi:mannose-6-phosphate isomerase-like protein (cupin superfamily)
MDELEKGLDVSLKGEAAASAAHEVRRQVESWGLSLPEVAPLVLDFGLGEFRSVGEVEFWIANEREAGYCGKLLFVWPDQTCPRHRHKEKLETFFIVRGCITMEYDGRETTMKTGDVLRAEPGRSHRFTGIQPTLILEVSMPSIVSDNYFDDTRIPIGGNFRSAGPPAGGR